MLLNVYVRPERRVRIVLKNALELGQVSQYSIIINAEMVGTCLDWSSSVISSASFATGYTIIALHWTL